MALNKMRIFAPIPEVAAKKKAGAEAKAVAIVVNVKRSNPVLIHSGG